eukprot:g1762.t1
MAFRAFLQNLKPGEIGFIIASIGSCSAILMGINSFVQLERDRSERRRMEWEQVAENVKSLVNEGKPISCLARIKYYQARLRNEARKCGIYDATTDEICDEWWRRRNEGDRDALEIENTRLELKRFWHSIERAARVRMKLLETSDDKYFNNESDYYDENETSNTSRHEQRVLKGLLCGGTDKNQVNDRLAQKTLMFLERLDLACCRNHPNCVWDVDQPSFYSFLRRQYGIDENWPQLDTNIDDFTEDAPKMNTEEYKKLYSSCPPTRVALEMQKKFS